ncbi:hypothetical protein EYF80_006798 [Liparis tanakae]|uniref:Uncharacterized protein n=1 Tax=Liparis tanakae TaxID=230148 RepID=A0A4Z2IYJ0_9TELE|nr:hypothetical protein EYF80_006798 [Liparis tanakae]
MFTLQASNRPIVASYIFEEPHSESRTPDWPSLDGRPGGSGHRDSRGHWRGMLWFGSVGSWLLAYHSEYCLLAPPLGLAGLLWPLGCYKKASELPMLW